MGRQGSLDHVVLSFVQAVALAAYERETHHHAVCKPQSKGRTAGKLAREADCMAAVQDCDGVVRLRGLYEDATSAYMVMDHCTGGDLEELVQVGCFCLCMLSVRITTQVPVLWTGSPHVC